MVITHGRRWMDPQSVPRGFLRFYVLSLLSRSPEAGYSIMRTIEETTDGAWRTHLNLAVSGSQAPSLFTNALSDSARSCRKPSEQAVSIARKTRRRPTTGRAGLNGCAPRSTHGKPEPRFSGLRSSVFDANAPSRVGLHDADRLLRDQVATVR